jgi:hypothetical protein
MALLRFAHHSRGDTHLTKVEAGEVLYRMEGGKKALGVALGLSL